MSYAQLLEVFWASHNPAAKVYSRQYRNAIFYLNEKQRRQAEESRRRLEKATGQQVYTAIEKAGDFYPAENYHQKYYLRQFEPVMSEFRQMYPDEIAFAALAAAAKINGYLGCYGQPEDLKREIGQFGLSPDAQRSLLEYVSTRCSLFKGAGCTVSLEKTATGGE